MASAEPRVDDLRELHELRPQVWLMDLAFDWACIAAWIALYGLVDSLWMLPAVSLGIGSRLHALGLLGHDVTHRLACRTRWLNDLGAIPTGWPLLVRVEGGYRPWHFEHHRKLGTPADPEIASYRGDAVYATPVPPGRVVGLFFSDLMGLGILDLLRFGRAVLPERWLTLAPMCLAWLAFFGIALWSDAVWIPLLLLWSLATGFWAVFRVRTWTEHVGAPERGSGTSHRFRAGPIARCLFFPHNTFCHYEHHLYPQVPYYHLPAVRARCEGPPIVSLRQLFREIAGPVEAAEGRQPEPAMLETASR